MRSSPNARHARERDSLRAVLESIGREADVAPLLARVLEHACELLDADHGVIGLTDAARGVVRPVAIRDMPSLSLGEPVPSGVGLVGQVLGTGTAVRVGRYADLPSPTLDALSESAMIGVPVRWGDALVGVFALEHPRDLLAKVGHLAVHRACLLGVRLAEQLDLLAMPLLGVEHCLPQACLYRNEGVGPVLGSKRRD
jgi:GAF domain-containing protein